MRVAVASTYARLPQPRRPASSSSGEGMTLLWGAERRRQVEPARGALPGARRPLVPDPQRARDDRLRRAAGAGRGRGRADGGERSEFLWSLEPRRRAPPPRRRQPRPAPSTPSCARRWRSSCRTASRWSRARPAGRRTHLDRFCAALWPARAEAAPRATARALAQRNALLGRIRAGAAPARLAGRLGPRAGRGRRRADRDPARGGRRAGAGVRRGGGRARARREPPSCATGRAPRPADAERAGGRAARAPRQSDLARGYTGPRPAPRRAGDLARRPLAAPLRLAGRAAHGAAGAAVRRAPSAARGASSARR